MSHRRRTLRIRHELGIAMVWVEHDMQMVADLADRICVLDSGTPIATGAPEGVLRDPRVVDAYLGRSADGP
jgi:branched-chain amino acid transport system ATP-binding protein